MKATADTVSEEIAVEAAKLAKKARSVDLATVAHHLEEAVNEANRSKLRRHDLHD